LTGPFFTLIISKVNPKFMDKERLKLIIANLELILDSLKSEVLSDPDAYLQNYSEITDYDEVFIEDDDGYQD